MHFGGTCTVLQVGGAALYRKDSRAPPQLPNFCKDLNPREKFMHTKHRYCNALYE